MGTLCGSVGFPGSVAELLVELPMKLAQARGEKVKSLLTDAATALGDAVRTRNIWPAGRCPLVQRRAS
jgi:hypothetical protein